MVTSAQLCQTCVVSSQSYRQPRTYSPGCRSAGMTTQSTICQPVQSPLQPPCCETGSELWPGLGQSGSPVQSFAPEYDAFGGLQPAARSPIDQRARLPHPERRRVQQHTAHLQRCCGWRSRSDGHSFVWARVPHRGLVWGERAGARRTYAPLRARIELVLSVGSTRHHARTAR